MPPTTAPKKGPVPPAKALKKPPKGSRMDVEDDLEDWKKSKQLAKPKDQCELLEFELKEVFARVLTTTNPQQPDNLVEFSYVTGGFVPVPSIGNEVIAFEREGTYIHIDTDEARKQLISQGIDPAQFESLERELSLEQSRVDLENRRKSAMLQDEAAAAAEAEAAAAATATTTEDGEEPPVVPADDAETQGGKEAPSDKDAGAEADEGGGGAPAGVGKKLTNQFNFCERAALTFTNPVRCQETQTIPPPMATFSANVLQWVIYDGYQDDYGEQMAEKERERERKEREKAPVARAGGAPGGGKKSGGRTQLSEEVQGRVFECWKVLERMLNQNSHDEIAKDYRYWEDPSDEYREEEGTLLPLWKFNFEKNKKNTVTDICWNPWYYDLFAVCFGFLDFMKPIPEGAVCLFTIKNPSYPEHICVTESGVMCVDIHPKYPYMVVVGLFDGGVNVFNVQASCKKPAFKSNSVSNKHSGIIWEVKWAPDLPDGEMNFFSVSADGKINNWVLMQNELAVTTVITLFLDMPAAQGPDGTLVKMKSCASCIVFHPKKPLIYMVGTEEGLIYKCSTNYSSMFLKTYNAHHMPVYRINFNKYNSDIFISCGGDWRIKIWEDDRSEPLFVFDLGAVIGDVRWAPYSSTIFAAVSTDGKVYLYDLNINKYKPICVQSVVSKKRNKLTRIDFNYKLPIIIVGDDKGCVTTLKLSPNLRIPCKAPKKQQYLDQWTLQCMKLDKLLAVVREPVTLSYPTDVALSDAS